MYLRAERYVSGYEFAGEEERAMYTSLLEASGLSALADPASPAVRVTVICAYWRKANAIHRWFVENVQGGVDECLPYYVSREKLQELHDLCLAVITRQAPSEEVLPTQEGFFFGSTEYDEGYMYDVEQTVVQLRRVLDFDSESSMDLHFEYRSSW